MSNIPLEFNYRFKNNREALLEENMGSIESYVFEGKPVQTAQTAKL